MTARKGNARPIFLFPINNDNFVFVAYHTHIGKFNFFKHYIVLVKFQFIELIIQQKGRIVK